MIIHSNGYNFRRGTGSPFDAVQAPEYDFGTHRGIPCQWCTRCKMSVDTTIEKYNQNQVWGMKQFCKRCGGVTQSAVYYHAETMDLATASDTNSLFNKAKEWSITPEKITK
jgi:hypothetical protein